MGAPNGAFLLFRRGTPGVGPWVSSVFVIDTSYVFCNNKTFPQNGGMFFGGKACWVLILPITIRRIFVRTRGIRTRGPRWDIATRCRCCARG